MYSSSQMIPTIFKGNYRRLQLVEGEFLGQPPSLWMAFRIRVLYLRRGLSLPFVLTLICSLLNMKILPMMERESRFSRNLARMSFMGRSFSRTATAVSMRMIRFPSPEHRVENAATDLNLADQSSSREVALLLALRSEILTNSMLLTR